MEYSESLKERMKKIRLIIMDVDGVLTDGGIYMGPTGEAMKRFDVKDGAGVALWHDSGKMTAIITGRKSEIVERRAEELHITRVFQGCADKREAYESLKKELGLSDDEIAYIGDDFIDVPVMKKVGLPVAVADASETAKRAARLLTDRPGGRGAVRETVEALLFAQGRFEAIEEWYTFS